MLHLRSIASYATISPMNETIKAAEAKAANRALRAQERARTGAAEGGALGLALLVAAVALLPRALGLADFVTIDEAAHWVDRSARFADAVADGRWAATHQTGHPGVTLMWLASLGLALERWAVAAGLPAPSAVGHLAWMRAPAAVLQALLIGPGYLLLRRLIAPRAALLAALLWATSPYLVAHGRLLHLDGLLTTFVTLSVLALLQARGEQHVWRPGGLLASGALAGLAILTKAPALILLPFSGLALLALGRGGATGRLLGAARGFALWLVAALLTVVLLHPALWADPGRVLHSYTEEIVDNGGRPNGAGQFFLGRPVDDPGPLFYPLASALRTTPLTLLGLLLFAGCAIRDVRFGMSELGRQAGAGPRPGVLSGPALALLLFVVLWFAVMIAGPKKFDRYVLPAWPALEALAALGLVAAYDVWLARFGLLRRRPLPPRPPSPAAQTRRQPVALALVLALSLGTLWWYHPYYLSYYNPLLGGGPVAQRALLIGWGEGMDQAGAWISARPDVDYGPVLTALEPTLAPFVPVPVKSVTELDRDSQNYAVVYLESQQRGANAAIYERIRRTLPLARIRIHGIEYATIHQLPKPFATPLEARFGEALHLWGVTVERTQQRVVVTPAWDVRAIPEADYRLFLHLLDAQGRQVALIDVPPGGADLPPTSAWQPGQQLAVPLPLELPPGLPPGRYQLTMGLYLPANGARLPLLGGPAADPSLAGPDALLVETIVVE
jgi:hypothetical protein